AALRNGPCAAGTALLQLVGQGDEVVAPESVSIVETRRPRLQAHVQPGHGGAHHGARHRRNRVDVAARSACAKSTTKSHGRAFLDHLEMPSGSARSTPGAGDW